MRIDDLVFGCVSWFDLLLSMRCYYSWWWYFLGSEIGKGLISNNSLRTIYHRPAVRLRWRDLVLPRPNSSVQRKSKISGFWCVVPALDKSHYLRTTSWTQLQNWLSRSASEKLEKSKWSVFFGVAGELFLLYRVHFCLSTSLQTLLQRLWWPVHRATRVVRRHCA